MTTYADPRRCPDCFQPIEYGAAACPHCDLPLRGEIAQRLYATLITVDQLLAQLREVSPAAAAPPATAPVGGGVAVPATRRRGGLSAASVPKILLSLGALCLLVAALVFLAVTWSVMDVTGRTVTLVGFTVVAGVLSGWMARRHLRAAAESLSLVALGLLTLDAFGARSSGWFGDLSTAGFLVLLGALLTVAASAAAVAVRRTPARALVVAEAVAAAGVATIVSGLATGELLTLSAALVVGVLLAAAATALAHLLRLGVATAGAGSVAVATWLALALSSLVRAATHPTLDELWLGLEAWPLVVTIGLVAAVSLVGAWPVAVRVGALALAEALVTVLAVLPLDDAPVSTMTLGATGVVAITALVTWSLRRPWSLAGLLPLSMAAVWMLGVSAALTDRVLERVEQVSAARWSGDLADRFPEAGDGALAPWLLPVAVVALLGVALTLAHVSSSVRRLVAATDRVAVLVTAVGGCLAATAVLYAVPIWCVSACALLCASLLVGVALVRHRDGVLLVSAAFLVSALVLALHSEGLAVGTFAVALGLTCLVHLRWAGTDVAAVAGAAVPVSAACLVWAVGATTQTDLTWVALVVIVVMALLAVGVPLLPEALWSCGSPVRARTAVEVGAAGATTVAAVLGTGAADAMATWSAVYLTLAGAAVTVIALTRRDRRVLTWLGAALLATASWVRLWDVGVRAPEAYTLPSAVLLLLVGLLRIRRDAAVGTMATLAPGLSLALVPSLLWALEEPTSPRSALLGLSCAALLAVGVRLRWTAPVLVSSLVGGLLVVRLAAPYVDAAVPRWMLIGAAGAVLVLVGATWERRLMDARGIVGYMRALR